MSITLPSVPGVPLIIWVDAMSGIVDVAGFEGSLSGFFNLYSSLASTLLLIKFLIFF